MLDLILFKSCKRIVKVNEGYKYIVYKSITEGFNILYNIKCGKCTEILLCVYNIVLLKDMNYWVSNLI